MSQSSDRGRSEMSRRQFVAWAGRGLTVGAVGLPFLLDACGSSAAPAPSSAAPASSAAAAPAS
ncbi:MAG: hypothetical protein ACRDGF_07580, partial [Chloroflexota bacterium]